jgi:hypothetical protein
MIAVSGPEGVGRWLHPPVRGGGFCLGLFNEVRNVEQKCEISMCHLETQSFCEFDISPL